MLILQCILGFHIQIIDLTNAFSQEDIWSGEPVFIELSRDFRSDEGQCDVFFFFEAASLWYENLRNGLLDHGFLMSKVDPYLFIYKTVICVVYVDDCLFWVRSQYEIINLMKSFK